MPVPRRKTAKSELTPQQRLFAHEYVRRTGNGKQAAIAAGYSEATAESQASRLLRNVKVARLVAELEAKQLAKVDASAERVKAELARLAFADVRRLFDADGNLKRPADLDDDIAAAIAGVDVIELFEGRGEDRQHTGNLRKVKLWSKTEALGLLAKHHGLLREIVELKQTADTSGITDEEWAALSRLHHEVRRG